MKKLLLALAFVAILSNPVFSQITTFLPESGISFVIDQQAQTFTLHFTDGIKDWRELEVRDDADKKLWALRIDKNMLKQNSYTVPYSLLPEAVNCRVYLSSEAAEDKRKILDFNRNTQDEAIAGSELNADITPTTVTFDYENSIVIMSGRNDIKHNSIITLVDEQGTILGKTIVQPTQALDGTFTVKAENKLSPGSYFIKIDDKLAASLMAEEN